MTNYALMNDVLEVLRRLDDLSFVWDRADYRTDEFDKVRHYILETVSHVIDEVADDTYSAAND